jgi:hypothetical protein
MKRLGAVALVVMAVVLGAAFAATAQDTTTTVAGGSPTLGTETSSYDRGQTMRVEGSGWPPSALLTVELCGNEARNGSVDCDARTSKTVATTKEGVLFADLLATAPPSPCPCVVHVFQPQGILDMAARVRINGVAVAPLSEEAAPARRLEVTKARLTGSNGLGAWFGAGPERTLELTVENTGDVAVDGAAIRAGWGRSSSPDQPIDIDNLKKLQPGDSVTVEVPVQLGALGFGRYVAAGNIAGFDGADFEAPTSTYPLGLLLVVVLLVVGAGVLVYRRLDSDDPNEAAPSEAAEAESEAAETDSVKVPS